jgi:RNase P subunit RPR2
MKARFSMPAKSRKHICPICDEPVYRVSRRWVDRLISRFISVQRYKCLSPLCGWEGNIPDTPAE